MGPQTLDTVLSMFRNTDIMIAYHDILCGDLINEGCSRRVYECAIDKSLVVKIELGDQEYGYKFDNVIEWSIWDHMKWLTNGLDKYFAPCILMSDNGRILLQKRTTPLTDKQWEKTKNLPSFLGDVKRENFGMYKGHICAHDYSSTLTRLSYLGITNKMRPISKEDRNR